MACLVNKPHLYRDTTTGIMVKRFGVGLSIGYLSPFYFCVLCRSVLLMARRLQPLINQMMSVDRRDGGIAVAVNTISGMTLLRRRASRPAPRLIAAKPEGRSEATP